MSRSPRPSTGLRIFVYPLELVDLDGDDLRVQERWGESACSEAPEVEAEDAGRKEAYAGYPKDYLRPRRSVHSLRG